MLRELVPGVLTWGWPSPRHAYDFNGFLVRDPGGNLCIDPAEPGEGDLDAVVREGVARVLITNRNHVRSANGPGQRSRSIPPTRRTPGARGRRSRTS
jgi:hypothetical protein